MIFQNYLDFIQKICYNKNRSFDESMVMKNEEKENSDWDRGLQGAVR